MSKLTLAAAVFINNVKLRAFMCADEAIHCALLDGMTWLGFNVPNMFQREWRALCSLTYRRNSPTGIY